MRSSCHVISAPSKVGAALAVALLVCAADLHADPLRLRGDAFVETREPVGILVLSAEDTQKRWLSAETLVWLGTAMDGTGDVLTMIVRARDPEGRAEGKVGRMLVATGSVRPLHLDGASVIGRAPWGTSLEAFGGAPVMPRFGERAYDWAVGGRAAQNIAQRATIGAAYVQERDHGDIASEEIGGDLAVMPARWLDLAARTAYDLNTEGLADALVSVAARSTDVRVEVFGTRRSSSHILPATSLFSVLGDVPSTRVGSSIRWRAAPRLDLLATGATEIIDDRAGADLTLRTTLRTDDEGRGHLGLELRRQDVPEARWAGIRGIAAIPLTRRLRAGTELELAHADHPHGRGDLWPWALVSLTYQIGWGWDVAAAAEAASTPTATRELVGLARASWSWERH
jgi:hypothetical protein